MGLQSESGDLVLSIVFIAGVIAQCQRWADEGWGLKLAGFGVVVTGAGNGDGWDVVDMREVGGGGKVCGFGWCNLQTSIRSVCSSLEPQTSPRPGNASFAPSQSLVPLRPVRFTCGWQVADDGPCCPVAAAGAWMPQRSHSMMCAYRTPPPVQGAAQRQPGRLARNPILHLGMANCTCRRARNR